MAELATVTMAREDWDLLITQARRGLQSSVAALLSVQTQVAARPAGDVARVTPDVLSGLMRNDGVR